MLNFKISLNLNVGYNYVVFVQMSTCAHSEEIMRNFFFKL